MKNFKQYLETLGESASTRSEVERQIEIAKQKRAQNLNYKQKEARRIETADTSAGEDWANKNIDTAQKATDYVTTGLSATQVGKPAAAIIQGLSSALDLKQNQYSDSAGRATSALVSALPGSEIVKIGSKVVNPLSTVSKTAVSAAAGKIGNTAVGKTVQNIGSNVAQNLSGKIATDAAKQAATQTAISTVSKQVATKAASDVVKAGIQTGVDSINSPTSPQTVVTTNVVQNERKRKI